jgi:hypothetical protein
VRCRRSKAGFQNPIRRRTFDTAFRESPIPNPKSSIQAVFPARNPTPPAFITLESDGLRPLQRKGRASVTPPFSHRRPLAAGRRRSAVGGSGVRNWEGPVGVSGRGPELPNPPTPDPRITEFPSVRVSGHPRFRHLRPLRVRIPSLRANPLAHAESASRNPPFEIRNRFVGIPSCRPAGPARPPSPGRFSFVGRPRSDPVPPNQPEPPNPRTSLPKSSIEWPPNLRTPIRPSPFVIRRSI